MRKISHSYRKAGKLLSNDKMRKASLKCLFKALRLYPIDFRLYTDIFIALIQNAGKDKQPKWELPQITMPMTTMDKLRRKRQPSLKVPLDKV